MASIMTFAESRDEEWVLDADLSIAQPSLSENGTLAFAAVLHSWPCLAAKSGLLLS
jgi:hypothetical protein